MHLNVGSGKGSPIQTILSRFKYVYHLPSTLGLILSDTLRVVQTQSAGQKEPYPHRAKVFGTHTLNREEWGE